ncbi:MAG: GntR family transcriptional regulator [Longimicrobiales bacterium]
MPQLGYTIQWMKVDRLMSRMSRELADSIRQQILNALDSGLWHRGIRLPSTREMADQLGVDPRLVAKAYRQLGEEGLVELRPRSGAYIAEESTPIRGAPSGVSEGWIVRVLEEAVRHATPVDGIAEWIRRATQTVRLRACVIAPTADQTAGLARELRLYYGMEASEVAVEEALAGEIPLGLRQADVLMTVESCRSIAEQNALVLGVPCICITVRQDIVGPAWDRFTQSPTFVIVSDERFGRMLVEYLSVGSGAERVQVLVAGRDDPGKIPESAIVYATQSARNTLGDAHINGSVLPQVQVISKESSTAILRFLVSANLSAIRAREQVR